MFKKVYFLGLFDGVSKSSNKPFHIAYMGDTSQPSKGSLVGQLVTNYFIEEDLANKLREVRPGTLLDADIRFIANTNVFIDFKK